MRLYAQYIISNSLSINENNTMAISYFTSGIRKQIGDNIKKARNKLGLEQIDVATIAGVNRSYYGKIEKGLANPSIEKLYKIIKALGVKSSDILPF